MNTIKRVLLMLALIAVILSGTVTAQTTLKYDEAYFESLSIGKNPIPTIAVPKYSVFQMSNGVKVYLMPISTMPIIKFGGFVRGGSNLENSRTSGSYCLVSQILSENEKDFKDSNALDLNFSNEDNIFAFEGSSLNEDLDKLIGVTKRTLCRTSFDKVLFEQKQRYLVQRFEDLRSDSAQIAKSVLKSSFYGKHPYAYQENLLLQQANIADFTVEKLNKFYTSTVVPQNTVLWLCGNFDSQQAEMMLRAEFEAWRPQNRKKVKLTLKKAKQQANCRGKIILVNKEDAAQATIMIASQLFDIEYGNTHMSEKIAFDLAGEMYGAGDFDSFLMKELRVKRDFVYGTSAWMESKQAGGMYCISTEVMQERAAETINIICQLVRDLQQRKILFSQASLDKIVNQRNAVYPGVFKSSENLLVAMIYNTELRNRSENYFNEFIAAYNETTLEQAEAAFAKFIDIDDAVIVVVGNFEQLLPQFSGENIVYVY